MRIHAQRFARCLISVLLLSALLCATVQAASYEAWINTNTYAFSAPNLSAARIGVASRTRVTLTSWKGRWAQVRRGNIVAYVPLCHVTLCSRLTAYAGKNTPLYKQQSTSSGRICPISKGTTVYIIGRDEGWCRVQNGNGSITGWIPNSAVTWSRPAVSSSGGSPVERLLAVARAQLGKPYQTNPNPPHNFDCSNYVAYCYKQAGLKVSCVARTLGYTSSMKRIPMGSLQAGDIVVFNTVSSDDDLSDHVGIYLGSGSFIHASSAAGKVIISNLSGYYGRVFSWGLRP